jgi:hypothetical protein
MSVTLKKIEYAGWQNCLQLSNGICDLVITTDVGPRIIRFGFTGRPNMFKEYKEQVGRTGDAKWNIYGGHRLWHAPEDDPRSYQPDNTAVTYKELNGLVRVTQPVEAATGLQKEMDIHLSADAAHVKVVHRITNHNMFAVEFALWCLTVMAQGGKAILPLPVRGTHPQMLMPSNNLTLWHFTDMQDPRWTWGQKYILLKQDARAAAPQKIGAGLPDGWIANANQEQLFVKKIPYFPKAVYADLGAALQTFTNADMLEVETLAPLAPVPAHQFTEHTEQWALFDKVPLPLNDADVDRHILPKVKEIKGF